MKRSSLMRDTLLALVLAATGVPSFADQSSGDTLWTRDKLTGDWGGARTYLSDHGIDIGIRLSYYGQRVSSGGRDQNGEWGGTMDYRLNLDGKKLFGTWDGLSFNLHARTRRGKDVLADAGAAVVEGRSTRVIRLWCRNASRCIFGAPESDSTGGGGLVGGVARAVAPSASFASAQPL